MSQSRVVIRSKDIPTVERIMQTTGVDSASDAISLLVSRYGDALIAWWKSEVHQCRHSTEPSISEPVIASLQDPGIGLDVIEL